MTTDVAPSITSVALQIMYHDYAKCLILSLLKMCVYLCDYDTLMINMGLMIMGL